MKKLMMAMLLSSSFLIYSAATASSNLSEDKKSEMLFGAALAFQQAHLSQPRFVDQNPVTQRLIINHAASEQVLNRYLKIIDPAKSWLTLPDIWAAKFLRWDELRPYEALYKSSLEAQQKELDFKLGILSDPGKLKSLDDLSEVFLTDRSKEKWAESPQKLEVLWRQSLKAEMNDKRYGWKKSNAELIPKLKAQYESAKIELSKIIHDNIQLDKAAFDAAMNAVVTVEPHSGYMPASDQSLSVSMTAKMVGIGATLTKKNDALIVDRVLPGSPALEAGLMSGDEIIGIRSEGEGALGEAAIRGEPIAKIISKIRGPKETTVYLTIKRGKDEIKSLGLERREIEVADQRASSRIKEIGGHRIGIIDLPVFGEYAAKDVDHILKDFDRQHVKAVVLNLNNNGGGRLDQAVALGSMFINGLSATGEPEAIVSTKPNIYLHEPGALLDQSPGSAYDKGPVAVLTNRLSASASEILAGAIKDYHRGFIVGNNTFGKGTVQNVIPISEQLGALKMTTAKFYTPSGVSTQLSGVAPDIKFPSLYPASVVGETSLEGHLSASGTKDPNFKAEHSPWAWSESDLSFLKEMHQKRIASNPYFSYVQQVNSNAKECPRDSVPLSYDRFEACQNKQAKAEKELLAANGYSDKESLEDLTTDQRKLVLLDPEPNETAAILADYLTRKESPQQMVLR